MTMDADLQNDPKDIPAFLKALEDPTVDCVCGTRVADRARGDDKIKVISSRIANGVRNAVLQDHVTDAGCTYRCMRRACVADLKLYRGLHRFIPTLLKMEGYKVVEVPVSNNPRLHGESKYGVWNRLFKSFRDMLAIRWMKQRLLGYEVGEQLNKPADTTPVSS
jgi:dolichol-phosphate mannosyltransferase